jgi:phytoene synthase
MTPFHLRQRLRRLLFAESPDEAVAYCRELVRKSGSNFSYAFLFLPPERKQALEAVYAFCRVVDDAVDVSGDASALELWRDELGRAFAERPGAPQTAIGRRLAEAAQAFPIHAGDLAEVLDGVAMDLEQLRYPTWEELRLYCRRVASAVGLVCVEIFGHSTDKTRRYARELGVAMQLTNILRDVRVDARLGRIYLPLEDLARFEVSEEDILGGRCTPAVRDLMHFEIARAGQLYGAARQLLDEHDRHRLFVAEIMADIYQALLGELELRTLDIMGTPLGLRRRRKLALAMRRWLESRLADAA